MSRTTPYPFDADRVAEICRQHDVAAVGVFGSAARGDVGEDSDIDLLVSFGRRKGLPALVRLEREHCHALGRKVDLLTEAGISPYLRERVLHEVRMIYEA